MPTSKARKRRIIAMQKRKQKDALSTKTRLGLNIQAKSLKKNSAVRSAIAAIVEGMKNAVKSPTKVSAKSDLTQLNENCIVDTKQRQTDLKFENHNDIENDNEIQDHHSHETKIDISCPAKNTIHDSVEEKSENEMVEFNRKEDANTRMNLLQQSNHQTSTDNLSMALKLAYFPIFSNIASFPFSLAKGFLQVVYVKATHSFYKEPSSGPSSLCSLF